MSINYWAFNLLQLSHAAPSLQQALLRRLSYADAPEQQQKQQQQWQQQQSSGPAHGKREQQQEQKVPKEDAPVLGFSECMVVAEAVQRFSLILPPAVRQQLEAQLPPEVKWKVKSSLASLTGRGGCPIVDICFMVYIYRERELHSGTHPDIPATSYVYILYVCIYINTYTCVIFCKCK